MRRLSTSNNRKSAGTLSPASKYTKSPVTNSRAGISTRCPCRITVASTDNMRLIFSSALLALTSCK